MSSTTPLDELLNSPTGQKFIAALRTTPKELYFFMNNKKNGHLIREFVHKYPDDAKEIAAAYEVQFGKPWFELARAIVDYQNNITKVAHNQEIIDESERENEKLKMNSYFSDHPEIEKELKKLVRDLGKQRAIDAIHQLEEDLEQKIRKIEG